ncbi:hypothetical protein [Telmatospirillum sp. J64-1]|uniref:hypothetical protein n=1 Tax=Telmatospirillum sp. J64-1 TaxID=2502183 RepID=UPI00115D8F88|nr:hypothetical protein [Telmatospirillum sp. J64-1]
MTLARPSTAVLFLTHFVDETILAEYRKLKREAREEGQKRDVYLVYNTTEHFTSLEVPSDVDVFRFDAADIRRLNYSRKDMSISSYNIDLFVLNFFLANQPYDHYWVIEYDVRFSGRWSTLFDHFDNDPSDLLGTTVYRYSFNPSWVNWSSLVSPEPGISKVDMIRAFLPVYRISHQGLQAVHAAYRAGWAGHCECTVPTILNVAGLKVADIGGQGEFVAPENHNRFYTNNPLSRGHEPGSLVFRPILTAPGPEPDKLWHPVKSPTIPGMVTGRGNRFVYRARKWMREYLPVLTKGA